MIISFIPVEDRINEYILESSYRDHANPSRISIDFLRRHLRQSVLANMHSNGESVIETSTALGQAKSKS